jgi:hypothetical protein
MQTYDEAQAMAQSRKRKLGNNTYLNPRDDGTIAVKYHETDVVIFHPDGSVVLDSGGWKTSTTKERLNAFSPAHVWQRNGIWYVKYGKETVPFADGMTLHPGGIINGAGKDPKAETRLRRKVFTYSKKYVAALVVGEVSEPSTGDCWFCAMRTADKGETLGEAFSDRDHILSHLEENYFVPSLIHTALERMGAAPVEFWALDQAWGKVEGREWLDRDFVQLSLRKHLARYCLRQLGMPA